MKREIKFRGKRIDKVEWIYGDLIQSTENEFSIWPKECVTLLGAYQVLNETVGQFTGLKDKNGREIWEGDVDKSGLVIKWNQLHCCWGLFNNSGYSREIMADQYDDKGKICEAWQDSSIEIIGNIHENPELL